MDRLTKQNITPTPDGNVIITYGDCSLTVHIDPDHYTRPLLDALHEFVTFVDVKPDFVSVDNMLKIVCGATETQP